MLSYPLFQQFWWGFEALDYGRPSISYYKIQPFVSISVDLAFRDLLKDNLSLIMKSNQANRVFGFQLRNKHPYRLNRESQPAAIAFGTPESRIHRTWNIETNGKIHVEILRSVLSIKSAF